jgi:hypothetical protein
MMAAPAPAMVALVVAIASPHALVLTVSHVVRRRLLFAAAVARRFVSPNFRPHRSTQAAETSRLTRWSQWISLRWSQQPFGRVPAAAALNLSPCASLSLMRRKARFALDRL